MVISITDGIIKTFITFNFNLTCHIQNRWMDGWIDDDYSYVDDDDLMRIHFFNNNNDDKHLSNDNN
ncbi:hypothetical protein DERP_010672 [Dermatophagoides pteronyssinus]|uniref:Uncharacterized protein n=1 Tax=Dermatophagoides pteronyssinus TaxID=6956 RepID=A0ABQ8JAJ8_DERPT|nr:hypothetical protein DERP_010672 [Dermatophagoides pteronyssinus]